MTMIETLVAARLGEAAAARAIATLAIDPAIAAEDGASASRAAIAMALNICLFDDLLGRVPSAAAYVADVRERGQRVVFDHGALRTIRFGNGPTGALPPGQDAFQRLLEPLGYRLADRYPLPRLKMTGHVYCHADFPETVPQFFVSELYVDRFDDTFAEAAHNVFDSSRDPIGADGEALLAALARDGSAPPAIAAAGLGELLAAFGRQHDTPALGDYDALRAQSAEAAWIATEGNAFNHATDRVPDVEALAGEQKALGRPIKDAVEVSASGRVRQTAFRADMVERLFLLPNGGESVQRVPGSFYEFITRAIDPETERLDLRFDPANATGIFAMTRNKDDPSPPRR
ncbi:MAG: DUF1338 family protein [Sphingomonadaceae bacterium]|nr:DUF1338 family protein [Sphingomonadaceae bacterium]